ncbi:DMT family transporter [Ideonella sp. DXS22W]|uniref:DMT family transporter n=1 Tax=Pseudaquabacterium inlustre TaxID=2984192 RepID=A0ABU9CJM3_9BURK
MSATTAPSRRFLLTLLVVLWLVWGTNWGLIPLAMREVSVWSFRASSCLLAGLVLLAVARWRGLPLHVPRAQWPTIAVATCFYLVLWNVASALAAVLIPSGQAAVLGFTMPLWAALIGWLLLGERLGRRMVAALALGAAAVALLAWRGMSAYAQAPLGVALALLAALGWAVGTLILKRGRVTVPALVLTGWQLLGTAVPLGAVALAQLQGPPALPSWPSVAVIVYIALVPMAVGNWCWFVIVGELPASVAGMSSIMVPVLAMVSGALMHGEPLGAVQLAAMACSGAGLWLALARPAPSGQR